MRDNLKPERYGKILSVFFLVTVLFLEGNFLFMDAIQEMYMQSWGGKVRIFPTVPESWNNASFSDLRAEGGYKVSAEREEGKTIKVSIKATKKGELKLKNPFATDNVKWSHSYTVDGDCLIFSLKKGDSVTGKVIP